MQQVEVRAKRPDKASAKAGGGNFSAAMAIPGASRAAAGRSKPKFPEGRGLLGSVQALLAKHTLQFLLNHVFNESKEAEDSKSGDGEKDGAKDIGDKHPSTPTGQRGSPLDVKDGTNKPTNIGDRDYSGHAVDRMQGRGVPPSVVEDAIRNGKSEPGNKPGTTVHTGESGVRVVTNQDGKVITVITR